MVGVLSLLSAPGGGGGGETCSRPLLASTLSSRACSSAATEMQRLSGIRLLAVYRIDTCILSLHHLEHYYFVQHATLLLQRILTHMLRPEVPLKAVKNLPDHDFRSLYSCSMVAKNHDHVNG